MTTTNPLPNGLYACPTCEGNINITRLRTHGVCAPCHDGQGIRMKKVNGAWVPHDKNGSPITTFCRQCSAPARVNPLGLCDGCSPAEKPATPEAKQQAAAERNAIWKEISDIAYELQPQNPEGIISAAKAECEIKRPNGLMSTKDIENVRHTLQEWQASRVQTQTPLQEAPPSPITNAESTTPASEDPSTTAQPEVFALNATTTPPISGSSTPWPDQPKSDSAPAATSTPTSNDELKPAPHDLPTDGTPAPTPGNPEPTGTSSRHETPAQRCSRRIHDTRPAGKSAERSRPTKESLRDLADHFLYQATLWENFAINDEDKTGRAKAIGQATAWRNAAIKLTHTSDL